jgi:hypothetical protein
MSTGISGGSRLSYFRERVGQRPENLFQFLGKLIPALPMKSMPDSADIWDMDHAGTAMGMLNHGFVRANCEAFLQVLQTSEADVVVDFWNPLAVIAARILRKPVVTVREQRVAGHLRGCRSRWHSAPLPTLWEGGIAVRRSGSCGGYRFSGASVQAFVIASVANGSRAGVTLGNFIPSEVPFDRFGPEIRMRQCQRAEDAASTRPRFETHRVQPSPAAARQSVL